MIALFFLSGIFFLIAGFFFRSKKFLLSLGKHEFLGKVVSVSAIVLGVFALVFGVFLKLFPEGANVLVLVYLVLIIIVSSVMAVLLKVSD